MGQSNVGGPRKRSSSAEAMEKRLLTTEELARYLGVRPKTVRNWRSAGKIPGDAIAPLAGVRYDKEAIDELNRTLTEVLSNTRLPLRSPFVFCEPDGSVKTAFKGAVQKAGLSDFRFHDLRHDFASWLTMKGCNEFNLMELMGHKTPAMAKCYAHLSPDFKRQAVRMLDEESGLGDKEVTLG